MHARPTLKGPPTHWSARPPTSWRGGGLAVGQRLLPLAGIASAFTGGASTPAGLLGAPPPPGRKSLGWRRKKSSGVRQDRDRTAWDGHRRALEAADFFWTLTRGCGAAKPPFLLSPSRGRGEGGGGGGRRGVSCSHRQSCRLAPGLGWLTGPQTAGELEAALSLPRHPLSARSRALGGWWVGGGESAVHPPREFDNGNGGLCRHRGREVGSRGLPTPLARQSSGRRTPHSPSKHRGFPPGDKSRPRLCAWRQVSGGSGETFRGTATVTRRPPPKADGADRRLAPGTGTPVHGRARPGGFLSLLVERWGVTATSPCPALEKERSEGASPPPSARRVIC